MSPGTETLPSPPNEQTPEDSHDPRFWIETPDFAELAGVERQTAWKALKRCHSGGTWHKTPLIVRMVDSVGGNGGKAYQVFAPSLPPELAAVWREGHPELFETPASEAQIAPSAPETPTEKLYRHRLEIADFRLGLIMPALRHPRHTAGRIEAIRGICSKSHIMPGGKSITPCDKTVYNWIRRYETAGGKQGLMPESRSDLNERRVIISRTFDNACPLPDEKKSELEAAIVEYVKGLFIDTFTSRPKIQLLASAELVRQAKLAGWAGADLKNCDVGFHLVRRHQHYRLNNVMQNDAQAWADTYKPRIHRTSANLLPMDIVMGDVHPVDILKEREDGTTATARMISWMDVATGRYIADYVLCGPRQGITQAHVAASFVKMVKSWGLCGKVGSVADRDRETGRQNHLRRSG